MYPTEALEPEQQATELILPAKHALNGIETFLEYVGIEKRLPATFGEFPASGIGIDIGHHATSEDRLPILPAIINPIQADNCSAQVYANGAGYSCHYRQGVAQERRFIMVARSRDKRRDDIAIPVAEGDDLIALDLL